MARVKEIFGSAGVIDQKEAAKMIGRSKRTVERRIAENRLLAKKDGRRVIVDRLSVLRYLENLPEVGEV